MIVEASYDYLVGRPYRLGGRGPEYYDCWGVVREISASMGKPLPDFERDTTTSRTMLVRLAKGQEPFARPIHEPCNGAIAYCGIGHVGIFHNGVVYTAEKGLGVVGLPLRSWNMKYKCHWYILEPSCP